jgi:GntR family transcriptional regulator, histidine utilization repressor
MNTKAPLAETLHQRILGDIQSSIVSGDWPPGHRLPFEVDLAQSYGVSRMTVNKVLTQLAGAGLIERRRKSGSFVAQPQVQSAILEIHDIQTEVQSLKLPYRFALLRRLRRKALAADMAVFDLTATFNVLAITCLHFAGDAPFCLEDRLINLDVVPEAGDVDFANVAPGKWLQQQVPWTTAEHRISARAADNPLARDLALAQAAPCLVVQRRTWNGQGPVTLVRFTYPADKHAVIARFTPATTP